VADFHFLKPILGDREAKKVNFIKSRKHKRTKTRKMKSKFRAFWFSCFRDKEVLPQYSKKLQLSNEPSQAGIDY